MDVEALRKILSQRNARWVIPSTLPDGLDAASLARPHPLGALPRLSSARTQRNPRIRLPPERRILWSPDRRLGRWLPHVVAVAAPRRWDWRNVGGRNFITAARDQGGCGSCVAFAVAAAIETHHAIATNRASPTSDLSEASLFFVANRQCNPGDPRYGWWIHNALDHAAEQGIAAERNYPYRDVNQVAELVDGGEATLKIAGYDSSSDRERLKRWIAEEGPLVTTFDVFSDFYTFWNTGANGIYTRVSNDFEGGHAVMVVGYDDDDDAWICKNSWGPAGPDADGCFRIGYGECKIDDRMYLPQDVYDVVTRDEIPYDPRFLRIVDEGPQGWLLTDGNMRMMMFDNKEDARNGLCVARRHNRQCFIGRDNARANRHDYIIEYWAGDSGLPHEPLTRTDAIAYNPGTVVARDRDVDGWEIRDGASAMLLADDLDDALAGLAIVERHTRQCFIGRGNTRPNRKNYIMMYWE